MDECNALRANYLFHRDDRKSLASLCFIIVIAITFLTCQSRIVVAQELAMIFPAYANPCCEGGKAMWDALEQLAADEQRGFNLYVVFNPASGPGTEIDKNYLPDSGKNLLAGLKKKGCRIYGYVATSYGKRSFDEMVKDIDRYFEPTYYGKYVDSIFLDEMAYTAADISKYEQLTAHVKSKSSKAMVMGNPGTPYFNNQDGTSESPKQFLTSVDSLMSFENRRDVYDSEYFAPEYGKFTKPSQIAHVVHTQKDWNDSLLPEMAKRGAGMIYITDDVMENPYDRLPTYWNEMKKALKRYNQRVAEKPPRPRPAGN